MKKMSFVSLAVMIAVFAVSTALAEPPAVSPSEPNAPASDKPSADKPAKSPAAEKSSEEKPEKPAASKQPAVTMQGSVSAVKSEDGIVISVSLAVDPNTVYKVYLNEKGMELGRTMDGKKVEVKGSISERIKKLLIVDEFKAAEAAAEPNEPK